MKIAAVVLCMLLVILSLVMSCAPSSPSSPSTNAPTPSETLSQVPNPTGALATKQAPPKALLLPILVTGTTSKSYYLFGEDIDIKISLERNPQNKEPLEINSFPPAITVKLRQDDESVRSFPAGTATRLLEPGEVVNYDLTWNQRNDQGQPVHYGYYYVSLGPLAYGKAGTLGPIPLSPFPILPAEGALEKTIEVNQSQTVNGITIKLERVESSNLGMNVSVFTIPPNPKPHEGAPEEVLTSPSGEVTTTLPEGPLVPTPVGPISFGITAEYQLDGGAVQKAFSNTSFVRLENGVECTWKNLDPVPKNTKLLNFTITELNGWEGPWEFMIPLD